MKLLNKKLFFCPLPTQLPGINIVLALFLVLCSYILPAAARACCILSNTVCSTLEECVGKTNCFNPAIDCCYFYPDNCCSTPNQARSCTATGPAGNPCSGTQTCLGGVWGSCQPGPTCDPCYNNPDCCTAGQTRSCTTTGSAGNQCMGTQTCSGGSWGGCQTDQSCDPCFSNPTPCCYNPDSPACHGNCAAGDTCCIDPASCRTCPIGGGS
jgi:hypothetical protein